MTFTTLQHTEIIIGEANLPQKKFACYAYDYWCEFQHSKANGVMTNTILVLIENLREDDTKEANEWIEKIRREIIS